MPQAVEAVQAPPQMITKYTCEETNENGGSIKFVGHDSTVYSADWIAKKGQPKTICPPNEFTTANFALMIFDKKIGGFRMVPVHQHINFEKQKPTFKRKPIVKPLVSKAPE